jgi:hypothetical protein
MSERPPDAESDASLRVIPDINVMAVIARSVAAAQDELVALNIHASPEASGAADVWVCLVLCRWCRQRKHPRRKGRCRSRSQVNQHTAMRANKGTVPGGSATKVGQVLDIEHMFEYGSSSTH